MRWRRERGEGGRTYRAQAENTERERGVRTHLDNEFFRLIRVPLIYEKELSEEVETIAHHAVTRRLRIQTGDVLLLPNLHRANPLHEAQRR